MRGANTAIMLIGSGEGSKTLLHWTTCSRSCYANTRPKLVEWVQMAQSAFRLVSCGSSWLPLEDVPHRDSALQPYEFCGGADYRHDALHEMQFAAVSRTSISLL